MMTSVAVRLEDIDRVIHETIEHKHKLLVAGAKNLRCWQTKVLKVKAVFHQLNMFNLNVTHMTLIGEAWCPLRDIDKVRAALNKGTEASGSSVPSIVNVMTTAETPPTYFRLNKFTEGFQAIVNAYGVADYREVNPALYTIITFPFLFAVMFGDAGHGVLMALFGAFLVICERRLKKTAKESEIFGMFYSGRYIILLMGLVSARGLNYALKAGQFHYISLRIFRPQFSIYTGFIYNDIFAKAMNIFGSAWRAPVKPDIYNDHIQFDPKLHYTGHPYWFGIDPIWQTSTNKILFLNSYKMKLSVILGVCQMLLGVCLSLFNHAYFKKPINIYCEFIPQIIFLSVIFGYMDILIIYKWFTFSAENSPCAPSILITLINMFMVKYPTEPCFVAEMYHGQKTLQIIFLLVAVVCVPWMLIVKPLIIYRQRRARQNYSVHYRASSQLPVKEGDANATEDVSLDIRALPEDKPSAVHEHEETMSDIVIHQIIHTIEYCLGSISHTASYLRLWALSLAHAQLSEVLWHMVMKIGLSSAKGVGGGFLLFAIFAAWAALTVAILLMMEGLSAFLHALRLQWVEFNSKFYSGSGTLFMPFDFKALSANAEESA